MMIHEITQLAGKHKRRKRIGRGHASGRGKTAGRGHKGARSRAGFGGSLHPTYEGGQMPYFRRIPKRGFNNAVFAKRYAVVNVSVLEDRFDDGATVNPQVLAQVGLIRDTKLPVKILGTGDLTKKLEVTAAKFSASAAEKIEKAGGSCKTI
ncbi:MAG: 50S ribosomal protein L15 [Phycisphaeraceae bacterium]|nr:50S ribosomal protein L15 [Phycisphaeraceae bacterium]